MNNTSLDVKALTNEVRKEKWRKRGKWPVPVLMHEIVMEGEATSFGVLAGYPFVHTMGVILDTGEQFDLDREWVGLRQTINREYKKDKNYLFNYANCCLKAGNKLIANSRRICKKDFAKQETKELGKEFKELIYKCKLFMPFMFSMHLVDELLTEKFEALLKEFIKNENKKLSSFFDYQEALAFPFKKIYALEERINLLRIAKLAEEKGHTIADLDKEVAAHTKRFGWLNVVNLEGRPFDEKHFLKKLKKTQKVDYKKEYRLIKKNEREAIKKQKIAMEEIFLFTDLTQISKAVQFFGFLRSFRVDALSISFFNSWNLFTEISRRLSIDVMDMTYLSSDETDLALNGDLNYKEIIKERKKNLVGVVIGDKRYELTGDDQEAIKKFFLDSIAPQEEVDEIKGSVAFPGKIQGICKVVHSLKEMGKIKKGDILIISMTDPNFLPAMERASAFVTDQGGILCHAAIVSREMKKPCIIATKIATQVLKDGDLVEVDAEKGTVRILKRK